MVPTLELIFSIIIDYDRIKKDLPNDYELCNNILIAIRNSHDKNINKFRNE